MITISNLAFLNNTLKMLKSTQLAFLFVLSQCGISQDFDYPDLYKSLDLPEYQDASVIGLGRQNESLKDGLKIFLESDADSAKLRAYYESKMTELGWELEESIAVQKMRERNMLDQIPFSGVFKKGDMTYQVFTTRISGKTKINITLLED